MGVNVPFDTDLLPEQRTDRRKTRDRLRTTRLEGRDRLRTTRREGRGMSERFEIRNGRVVTPTHVVDGGRVVVEGDRIVEVDGPANGPSRGSRTIDADGCVVMPGIVDLHGDDVEGHLYPRSGVRVDVRTALLAADRANLVNGVTTKFHAVAFEDGAEDDRSLSDATDLARAIADVGGTLADNRLHARCELTPTSVDAVERVLETAEVDLLSVMHHAPGDGQFDEEGFVRHYAEDKNWSADRIERAIDERRSTTRSTRAELTARIAALARAVDAPLASHDDASPEAVDRVRRHGATISEYPLTHEAARRATERGMTTAMGAPNLVRGGSQWDNLCARSAIADGLVDVLCADYHPPSLLAAPFVDTGEPLPDRVNRVTRNPADAVGFHDRGRIEAGARADLILVDPDPVPTVERVVVGGSETVTVGRPERDGALAPPAGDPGPAS